VLALLTLSVSALLRPVKIHLVLKFLALPEGHHMLLGRRLLLPVARTFSLFLFNQCLLRIRHNLILCKEPLSCLLAVDAVWARVFSFICHSPLILALMLLKIQAKLIKLLLLGGGVAVTKTCPVDTVLLLKFFASGAFGCEQLLST
jgi:hypothetical protein